MASDQRVAHMAGALGPRLAGRLTAELILRSPQYMNCLKQYEINLRGNKIAAIENLGATENQFDSIDLSDNAIVRLEGFPKLPRLKQLLLNNNKISRIAKKVEEAIPNIETLVLTNNRLTNLQDLDGLAGFPKLSMLSLIGNPVVAKQNYRLYVISKLKRLKILDFKKVKQKERQEALKLFPTEEEAAKHGAKTFEPDEDLEAAQAAAAVSQEPAAEEEPAGAPAASKAGPTPEQLVAIKAAIANAQTMEEIQRLEEALKTGHMPSEVQIDGAQPMHADGNGAEAGHNGEAHAAGQADKQPGAMDVDADGDRPQTMEVG